MPNVIEHNKRRSRIIFAGAIACIVCANLFAYMSIHSKTNGLRSSQYPICSSREYNDVSNGMTKDRVIGLLGEPQSKRIKSSPDQNFFSQGDSEVKIKEGWIYHLRGQSGSAEIYFDRANHVNGKGCGVG